MITIKGKVISGYGVASGKGEDPRYPNGTLILQMPHFKQKGLDLSNYYRGTINIDINPLLYKINKPTHFIKGVDWSNFIPPENFYFFEVELVFNGLNYFGLIYMPDPDTKTDHHQINSVLEVIMPPIKGIRTGKIVILRIGEKCLDFKRK